MSHPHHDQKPCAVTGVPTRPQDLTPLSALRPNVADALRARQPGLKDDDLISRDAINNARSDYVRDMLAAQMGELTHLEEDVLKSMHSHEVLAENPVEETGHFTLGQRLADKIAEFGGSWRFICFFGLMLGLWMGLNVLLLRDRAFDPYPFILLNLILSCIAAIQAPVIMMSQRRQEERDRTRAQNDYKINLKAELEIRHLHEKMDYLLRKNSERMMEIQQIQIDLMREISRLPR